MRAASLLLLWLAAGCGSPALTCSTASCSSGIKTYQVCVNTDRSETYNFGGQSCHCSAGDTQGCDACAGQVASYCGGGSGGNDGGQPGSCSITLSGAVTGTFACSAIAIYANSSALGGVTLTVGSPSPLGNLSVTIQRPGMPANGNWSQADVDAKAGLVVQQPGTPPPTWEAAAGSNMDQGSYSMSATFSGGTATCDGMIYTGTGNITALLPAVPGTGASGEVNLTATF